MMVLTWFLVMVKHVVVNQLGRTKMCLNSLEKIGVLFL